MTPRKQNQAELQLYQRSDLEFWLKMKRIKQMIWLDSHCSFGGEKGWKVRVGPHWPQLAVMCDLAFGISYNDELILNSWHKVARSRAVQAKSHCNLAWTLSCHSTWWKCTCVSFFTENTIACCSISSGSVLCTRFAQIEVLLEHHGSRLILLASSL